MIIKFEGKDITGFDEDIIFSWFIKTPFNNYRVTKEFIGAIDPESGEEDLEKSIFCDISVYEISQNKPEILKSVVDSLPDIEFKTYEDTVYNTHPTPRACIYVRDEGNLSNTNKIFEQIMSQLIKELLTLYFNKAIA